MIHGGIIAQRNHVDVVGSPSGDLLAFRKEMLSCALLLGLVLPSSAWMTGQPSAPMGIARRASQVSMAPRGQSKEDRRRDKLITGEGRPPPVVASGGCATTERIVFLPRGCTIMFRDYGGAR